MPPDPGVVEVAGQVFVSQAVVGRQKSGSEAKGELRWEMGTPKGEAPGEAVPEGAAQLEGFWRGEIPPPPLSLVTVLI